MCSFCRMTDYHQAKPRLTQISLSVGALYLEQSGQLLLQQSLDLGFAQRVLLPLGAGVGIEGLHQDGHGCLQLRHVCCFAGGKEGEEKKRRAVWSD